MDAWGAGAESESEVQAYDDWASQPYDWANASLEEQLGVRELSEIAGVSAPSGVPGLQDLYDEQDRNSAYNDLDRQVGHDLAWASDPRFQYTPEMLGQSQMANTYGDPRYAQQQQDVYDRAMGLSGSRMQFEGSGRQDQVWNELNSLSAPDWTGSDSLQQDAYGRIAGNNSGLQMDAYGRIASNNSSQQQDAYGRIAANNDGQQQQMINRVLSNNSGQQQDAYGRIAGNNSAQQNQMLSRVMANNSDLQQRWLSAIESNNSAEQQKVLKDAESLYKSGGKEGLEWDDGSRQQEQYDRFEEIIDGGGATEIERARRASARADSESWLRGQREADMDNLAARGMMGSGAELATLQMDRQAAASRNSLADLETAAELEARRMSAITSNAGLATDMRAQKNSQEQFEAGRSDMALGMRGDMSNAIRSMDLQRAQAGMAGASDIRAMDQQRDIAGLEGASAIRGMDLSRDQSLGQLASQIRSLDLQRDSTALQGATDARGMNLQRDLGLGNLATDMRSLDLQRDTSLGTLATQTRSLDLQRDLGLGGLATDMRGQNFQEQSFNAGYNLDVANSKGNLANTMRNQTYNEQVAQRNSDLQSLGLAGTMSSNMRASDWTERSTRAAAADQFAVINNAATNSSRAANTGFLQDSYTRTQDRRSQEYMADQANKTGAAIAGMGFDQRENGMGANYASGRAAIDAQSARDAKQRYEDLILGINGQKAAADAAHADNIRGTSDDISAGTQETATAIAGVYGGIAGAAGGDPAANAGQTAQYRVQGYKPRYSY
jgi:hypothetical protein